VTITDVAAAAGVSRATVSRVVNNLQTVDPAIAEKVQRVIAELDYKPSGTARSLSLGITQTVAMIVPNLGNPVFQQVLRGVTIAAARDGFRVLVADSQEDIENEESIARDVRRYCDAVILCSPRLDGDRLVDLLHAVSPAAVINRSSQSGTVPAVTVDYAGGVRELVDHLLGLGHRRFAYLAGPPRSASNVQRIETLQRLAAERDLTVEFIPCGHTMDDGFRAWDDLQTRAATAVLTFNDIVALGLLGRLAEEGVPVPERLSVAGFDGIQASRFSSPPLTTMAFDHVAMGESAWAALREEMTGTSRHGDLIIPPVLVPRRSTGSMS
jgi:LacI family transcriptional regulator